MPATCSGQGRGSGPQEGLHIQDRCDRSRLQPGARQTLFTPQSQKATVGGYGQKYGVVKVVDSAMNLHEDITGRPFQEPRSH